MFPVVLHKTLITCIEPVRSALAPPSETPRPCLCPATSNAQVTHPGSRLRVQELSSKLQTPAPMSEFWPLISSCWQVFGCNSWFASSLPPFRIVMSSGAHAILEGARRDIRQTERTWWIFYRPYCYRHPLSIKQELRKLGKFQLKRNSSGKHEQHSLVLKMSASWTSLSLANVPLQAPISTTRGAVLPLCILEDPGCLQFGAQRCAFSSHLFITV